MKKMVQQMLLAIEIFQLTIVEVSSTFKLSQERSTECRRAFQDNLKQLGNDKLASLI